MKSKQGVEADSSQRSRNLYDVTLSIILMNNIKAKRYEHKIVVLQTDLYIFGGVANSIPLTQIGIINLGKNVFILFVIIL